jgi:hypothetical protein
LMSCAGCGSLEPGSGAAGTRPRARPSLSCPGLLPANATARIPAEPMGAPTMRPPDGPFWSVGGSPGRLKWREARVGRCSGEGVRQTKIRFGRGHLRSFCRLQVPPQIGLPRPNAADSTGEDVDYPYPSAGLGVALLPLAISLVSVLRPSGLVAARRPVRTSTAHPTVRPARLTRPLDGRRGGSALELPAPPGGGAAWSASPPLPHDLPQQERSNLALHRDGLSSLLRPNLRMSTLVNGPFDETGRGDPAADTPRHYVPDQDLTRAGPAAGVSTAAGKLTRHQTAANYALQAPSGHPELPPGCFLGRQQAVGAVGPLRCVAGAGRRDFPLGPRKGRRLVGKPPLENGAPGGKSC